MFPININDILCIYNIHYNTMSTSCMEKISIYIIDKDTFSICGIDKFSVSGIDKSIYFYIESVYFVYT